MEPITNKMGDTFLEFIPLTNEKDINSRIHTPLIGSWVIAEHEGKLLLVFPKKYQHWELPSGRIEEGETPGNCARRELFEESGQSVNNVDFIGLAKMRANNGKVKFAAIFTTCLSAMTAFQPNEEIEKNTYWDFSSNIGYISEIDRYLANMVSNH